jgi:hypothetical protein
LIAFVSKRQHGDIIPRIIRHADELEERGTGTAANFRENLLEAKGSINLWVHDIVVLHVF